MADFGDIITDAGSAVQQLFNSEGDAASANSYSGAAALATQNAQLSATSTKVQETQTARQVYQGLSTQEADVAGAGFTESGSALYLLQSSQQQGALAKSLVNIQGAINENAYAAQAGALSGEAAKANEASTAGLVSAIGSIGGALVGQGGGLASAGQTVSKGLNYLFGDSSVSGSVGASNPAITVGADGLGSAGVAPTTDSAISSASTIDTSGVAIGDSSTAVSTAVGDVSDEISSSVSDAFDGIASASSLATAGLSAVAEEALTFIPGFSSTQSMVQNAVSDFYSSTADTLGLGGIYDSVTSFLGSVICTAFYKRGCISRTVWVKNQQYGRHISPVVYSGYLFWGSPIAWLIGEYRWFAYFTAPVFVPVLKAIAAEMGTGRPSFFGYMGLKVLYGASWIIGQILNAGRANVTPANPT